MAEEESCDVYVPQLQETYSTAAIKEAIKNAAKVLGYASLRPEQLQVVEKFVSGRDVFMSLPTGGGKCFYACLALVYDKLRAVQQQWIVVVVSLLNALMQSPEALLLNGGRC